ncbi:MAG TPA: hypothetical protein VGV35_12230 [Bryobacteraceae bacterium]|nr:hypothetical protein [Bryobacteraceae bacterium]
MDQPVEPVYCFGPFRYDFGQRLLFRGGEMVSIVPLLEHPGRVVDKAELMKLVWPHTVVEEIAAQSTGR